MSLTYVGYYNFNKVFCFFVFAIGCVATRGYHGGTKIHGFGIGQPYGLTCGFNDGLLGRFILGKSPPNEPPLVDH
jgi:hypothetical protein